MPLQRHLLRGRGERRARAVADEIGRAPAGEAKRLRENSCRAPALRVTTTRVRVVAPHARESLDTRGAPAGCEAGAFLEDTLGLRVSARRPVHSFSWWCLAGALPAPSLRIQARCDHSIVTFKGSLLCTTIRALQQCHPGSLGTRATGSGDHSWMGRARPDYAYHRWTAQLDDGRLDGAGRDGRRPHPRSRNVHAHWTSGAAEAERPIRRCRRELERGGAWMELGLTHLLNDPGLELFSELSATDAGRRPHGLCAPQFALNPWLRRG